MWKFPHAGNAAKNSSGQTNNEAAYAAGAIQRRTSSAKKRRPHDHLQDLLSTDGPHRGRTDHTPQLRPSQRNIGPATNAVRTSWPNAKITSQWLTKDELFPGSGQCKDCGDP